MVNYHDPVVVTQDYGAYTHPYGEARELVESTDSFDSDIIEALACFGWTLLVCLLCRSCPLLS